MRLNSVTMPSSWGTNCGRSPPELHRLSVSRMPTECSSTFSRNHTRQGGLQAAGQDQAQGVRRPRAHEEHSVAQGHRHEADKAADRSSCARVPWSYQHLR